MSESRRFSISALYPSLPFAAFTLWLLAFPLSGPLQSGNEHPYTLVYFLVPHIACLLCFAFYVPKNLSAVTAGGVILTMLATAMFAMYPQFSLTALVLSGAGAAAMAVRVGTQLSTAGKPWQAASVGLILANLLLAGLESLPLDRPLQFVLVTSLLLLPLSARLPDLKTGGLKSLGRVLPFVFVYHLVAGFLYSFLMPLYQQKAWQPGFEIVFYCLAVVAAMFIFRPRSINPLLVGVILAIISCVVLYPMSSASANYGMWTMQAASGFVDLFLVAFLVSCKNPAQAFAAGCATICSGILGGFLISELLYIDPSNLIFVASIILNLAALSLFLIHRHDKFTATSHMDNTLLPAQINQLLSSREREVLLLVINGVRYREVAARMSISESSVKTYMNRIFEKTQTNGKKQLLRSLQS